MTESFRDEPYEAPPQAATRERTSVDLTKLGSDRLLTLLGGLCAIGFGTLALVLHLVGEGSEWARSFTGFTSLGGVIFTFALTLVFGIFLLLAFMKMESRPAEGAILGLAFSIVLLAFGSTPGVIAGIMGLVGSLVGVVRNLDFVTK